MNQSKLNYSAPEAEVFVVRYERGCCQSKQVSVGANRGNGYGDTMYLLDDDED